MHKNPSTAKWLEDVSMQLADATEAIARLFVLHPVRW